MRFTPTFGLTLCAFWYLGSWGVVVGLIILYFLYKICTLREMRGVSLLWVCCLAVIASARPNVVLILSDDMGWGDLGCYGSKLNPTPNLNRLAAEGMRFTSFYATQAVCTSSRASLLTGCYSNRLGLGGMALPPNAKIGLSTEEKTIGTLLRAKGYHTCAVGKWHVGDNAKFLPPAHGFEESLILPYSNDMWPNGYLPGDPNDRKYPPLPWYVDGHAFGTVKDWTDMDQLTTIQGFRANKFLKDHAHTGRPFFLYLATSMPHTPLGAASEFKGKGPTPYAETMADIDAMVGRLMATLEQEGIAQNTIVIFTSDNGPWLNFGTHAGSAGPFREGKGTTWEGGVRVPMIVRWPGVVKPGTVTSALAANLDFLPTIVEACEAQLPELPIDGQSFLPLLQGKSAQAREVFAYYYGDKLEAIRQGPWKLHLPHDYRSYELMSPPDRSGHPMAYNKGHVEFALYNLETDPGERNDVSAEHPELVKSLKQLAEQERAKLNAGKRPVGKI